MSSDIRRFIIFFTILLAIAIIYPLGVSIGEEDSTVKIQGESIEFDGTKQVAIIEGNVVVIYGSWQLTSERGEYDDAKGEVRLFGGVKVQGSNDYEGTNFEAMNMTIFMSTRMIKADDQVLISYDNIIISSESASFDIENELFTAEKNGKIIYYNKGEGAGSHNNIEAVYGKALFFMSEDRILLTGNPKVVRGSNTFTGKEIVIYLKDNKIQASGGTKLEIEGVGL